MPSSSSAMVKTFSSFDNIKLETSAEKNIGKEINVVEAKDYNHLDLVIEAKNNRLKSEFFYIYDYDKFNNCSLMKPHFDVISTDGVNHKSARYVIHYLTKDLKRRFRTFDEATPNAHQHSFHDIFKPSLGQFDDEDIAEANDFIRSLFPFEGCSYTGDKIEQMIAEVKWITLILSLRIVWSLLPGAIIPWDSFNNFEKSERKSEFKNLQSFYQILPRFLPSHNHACVLFEFLEILLAIFSHNYFLEMNVSIDLIFTAGQICFNRDEFTPTQNRNDDDLNELQQFYYKRGYAFYQIFISYLRSLSQEPTFDDRIVLENFKINEYPPKPYKPLVQKALTLTVSSGAEFDHTNYFKLISNAANATSRIYSSNHSFTKFENKFLEKFEVNPYKIIENFFSKSSRNYLLKFDKNLKFDDFKINNDMNDFRKNLKNGTLFENKELISTFINDFSRYGFDGNNADNGGSFVADTINFNFSSNYEVVNRNPVRVSKLDISEWFINAWKYETFLGHLKNTVVLKLTKTIGDCDWLIITTDDKVSNTNRYLTPPSSASDSIDVQKNKELGGEIGGPGDNSNGNRNEKVSTNELLPAITAKNKSFLKHNRKQSSASSSKALPSIIKKSPSRSKAQSQKTGNPSSPRNLQQLDNPISLSKKPLTPVIAQSVCCSSPISSDNKRNSPLPQPPLQPAADPTPTSTYSAVPSASSAGSTTATYSSQIHSTPLNGPDESTFNSHSAPVIPNQRIFTPPQQISKTVPKPPSMVKDVNNTNSLTGAESRKFNEVELPEVSPYPQGRSSHSPLHQHPYQQLQKQQIMSPKNIKAPSARPSVPYPRPAPQFTTPPSNNSPKFQSQSPLTPNSMEKSIKLSSSSESTLGSSGNDEKKQRRFSKLTIATNVKSNVKTFSSPNSPITQAIPKFFKKNSGQENLGRIPSSDSTGSLSFINDGSGKNTHRPSLIVNNPELQVNIDSIPEIPYTPQALRFSSGSKAGSKSSSAVDLKTEEIQKEESFTKLVNDSRESFVGEHAFEDHDKSLPELVEGDVDITQDDTKTSIPDVNNEIPNHGIDGLLEEIKESLDDDVFEKYFSTDNLVEGQTT